MTEEHPHPDTWEIVLLRCPKCTHTVMAARAADHADNHCVRLAPGDYIKGGTITTKRDAEAVYMGRGRATFLTDRTVRTINEWAYKP